MMKQALLYRVFFGTQTAVAEIATPAEDLWYHIDRMAFLNCDGPAISYLQVEPAVELAIPPMYDFPMAWDIQREVGSALPHHPKCSSVPQIDVPIAGPGFLCDCGANENEWRRRYGLSLLMFDENEGWK